jgi:hypothetical protein
VQEAKARAPTPPADEPPAPAPEEEAQLPTPPSERGGYALPAYDSDDEFARRNAPGDDEIAALGLEMFAGPAECGFADSPPSPVVVIPLEESTLEDIE